MHFCLLVCVCMSRFVFNFLAGVIQPNAFEVLVLLSIVWSICC